MFFKSTILALLATAFAAPASELEARAGTPVDYTQDYVASGASVTFTPNQSAGSFSINFNTQADFVCGLGWTTGDSNPITYSGSFSGSGVALLSVYGWTTNPLVEYYIIEDPIGYPKQGTKQGTFTSDGSTYDVYLHQQVNQPSIQASSSTFNQYISIRNTPRSSGTVTVANHFNQWATYGLKLGTMNYQTLSVESWSGSGTGSLTVAKGTSSGTTSGSPPVASPVSPSQPSTPPASTGGGSCAAKYGQCGGTGWQGATCCASGSTCQASNSYYSQCL